MCEDTRATLEGNLLRDRSGYFSRLLFAHSKIRHFSQKESEHRKAQ